MAPAGSGSRMSEDDRLRRDLNLMNRLNIVHRSESAPEEWPEALRATFQSIYRLGRVEFGSYGEGPLGEHSRASWRLALKSRAQKLAEITRRLERENPPELTWRLELEALVTARFSDKIECPTCKGRLWRSELEVATETEGPVAKSLKSRRETRVPCECENLTYPGLNPLFTNRSDQTVVYPEFCTVQDVDPSEMPSRRPDRVYGLLHSKSLSERLRRPAETMRDTTYAVARVAFNGLSELDIGRKTVEDLIHTTPFRNIGDPLHFPFLVFEAKSEDGNGFHRCGIQTALPIWAFLNYQRGLQADPAILSEQGGPLVWYIAYRGDNWRVSGACVVTKDNQTEYRIVDLWNGRVSSPDGALQLLLIMDYIFDWARDLYRPLVLRLLDALSSVDFNNEASIAADSDIYSTRHLSVDDVMMIDQNSGVPLDENPQSVGPDEIDLECLDPWTKYDLRDGSRNRNVRGFRHVGFVRASFRCLYVTGNNLNLWLSLYGDDPSTHCQVAEQALDALCYMPLKTSDRILTQMEYYWTAYSRPNAHLATGRPVFCCVGFETRITESLEIKEVITCFAFDEEALAMLRALSSSQTTVPQASELESRAPTLDTPAFLSFFQYVRKRSAHCNFSLAISSRVEVLGTLTPQADTRLETTPCDLLTGLRPSTTLVARRDCQFRNIVLRVHRRRSRQGSLNSLAKSNCPYLRFSEESAPSKGENGLVENNLFIPRIPGFNEGHFLLLDTREGVSSLCVFLTGDNNNNPSGPELASILLNCLERKPYSYMGGSKQLISENTRCVDGYLVSAPEEMIPTIDKAVKRWYRDLCETFSDDEYMGLAEVSDDEEEGLHQPVCPVSPATSQRKRSLQAESIISKTKRKHKETLRTPRLADSAIRRKRPAESLTTITSIMQEEDRFHVELIHKGPGPIEILIRTGEEEEAQPILSFSSFPKPSI